MRNALLFAATSLLIACGDIAPTEQVDLCEGNDPPSDSCPQCKTPPFAKDCPKCKHQRPEDGCENATSSGTGGAGGESGGSGGSGGTGGTNGTGGSSGMGAQAAAAAAEASP